MAQIAARSPSENVPRTATRILAGGLLGADVRTSSPLIDVRRGAEIHARTARSRDTSAIPAKSAPNTTTTAAPVGRSSV